MSLMCGFRREGMRGCAVKGPTVIVNAPPYYARVIASNPT